MKLIEIGNSPPTQHALLERNHGSSRGLVSHDGARLEARFGNDPTVLQFALAKPGMDPCSAEFDISWIAYADQAERLEILARMALVDIDLALLAQQQAAPALS